MVNFYEIEIDIGSGIFFDDLDIPMFLKLHNICKVFQAEIYVINGL